MASRLLLLSKSKPLLQLTSGLPFQLYFPPLPHFIFSQTRLLTVKHTLQVFVHPACHCSCSPWVPLSWNFYLTLIRVCSLLCFPTVFCLCLLPLNHSLLGNVSSLHSCLIYPSICVVLEARDSALTILYSSSCVTPGLGYMRHSLNVC